MRLGLQLADVRDRADHVIDEIIHADDLLDAERVLVLADGKIVSEGTPDQLHNMTRMGDTVRIVARADESAAKNALNGVKNVEIKQVAPCADGVEITVKMTGDQREALFLAAAKANLPVLEMGAARKPLDQLLEALTVERVEGGGEEA